MTNVQSKLQPFYCTCQEFLHPWTDSCIISVADIILQSVPQCFRIYTVVYLISMVMRRRIPTISDVKRTVLGITQSAAFLSVNSFSFILYVCLLRNIFGKFYYWSNTFLPAFLASLSAIYIERPVRRPLLALYVANVATETLWRMLEARGMVQSIPNGQVLVFSVSISILLYIYRLGLHKTECKDSIFDILSIFLGRHEETVKTIQTNLNMGSSFQGINTTNNNSTILQAYAKFINRLKGKHPCCPHSQGCLQYAVTGGFKPFVTGVALQVTLKLLLNVKNIFTNKKIWYNGLFDKKILDLGLFLGSFSFLYKGVSCGLRNIYGKDSAFYAIPAGIIGGISFVKYPDITIALYVMWKALQLIYNIGEHRKVFPKMRWFIIALYCWCTALLFQAAIMEPQNLRPSYYKFLHSLSGARVALFNRHVLDMYGLNSSDAVVEVMKRTGTNSLPTKLLGM